jgi:hypothetical protein
VQIAILEGGDGIIARHQLTQLVLELDEVAGVSVKRFESSRPLGEDLTRFSNGIGNTRHKKQQMLGKGRL